MRKIEWMSLVQSATLFLVVLMLIGQQFDVVPTVPSRNHRSIESLTKEITDLKKAGIEMKQTTDDRKAIYDAMARFLKSREDNAAEYQRRKAEHDKNAADIEARRKAKEGSP